MMRTRFILATLAITLVPALAAAQPVSFQLKNDVPAGQKPTLSLKATQRVLNVKLELERDDGQKFSSKVGALDVGKATAVPIGDGKAGKAHYAGKLSLEVAGQGPWSFDLSFDTLVRAAMTVNYDFDHLDLAGHVLRFQQSRPAGRAEVVAIGDDGGELGRGAATYKKEPPGTWLAVRWTPTRPGRVMTIRLHAVAADGLGVNLELVPWAVEIEHEDVNFDTDTAAIKPGEASKLDASLARIREVVARAQKFVKVKLYVAGHTDTVGGRDRNLKLSHERARAIAEYFRKKGLTIPIVYEGFGEDVPKVQTPDSTDEPRNRRADYVLGALGAAPPFGGAYRGVRASWTAIE